MMGTPERSLITLVPRSPKDFGPQRKAEIWDRTNGHCAYCGKVLNPWRDFSIDHFVSLCHGGTHAADNVWACCRTCNGRKGTKTAEEFRIHLAKVLQGVIFTDAQRAYLESIGVQLPEPEPYVFWFEREGLSA